MKNANNRKQALILSFFMLLLHLISARAETISFTCLPSTDTDPYQLTVNLIDFPTSTPENTFLLDSSGSRGTKTCPGLLSGYLVEDGYPLNQEGESMAALFSDAVQVNCLFPERADGWWLFDSTQCFVTLQRDRFVLYRELGTVEEHNSSVTLNRSQFLPFNTITSDAISTLHTNINDALGNELPDSDPRKNEPLYAIPANEANHYFGLTLDAAFTFPAPNDTDEELIASFTADDDLWVIRFQLISSSDYENIRIMMVLFSQDTTRIGKTESSSFSVKKGMNEVLVKIPCRGMADGEYYYEISIWQQNLSFTREKCDSIYDVIPFIINNEEVFGLKGEKWQSAIWGHVMFEQIQILHVKKAQS